MPMNDQLPLVSVLVYNFNYGKYLNACLASIFHQTYPNIEVLFSDNASTDDSWDIALDWQKENPSKMFVARNRLNYGTDANLRNCSVNRRGKYHLVVGSDDVIDRDYVSACVDLMETYLDAGFCMVHRRIMDSEGVIVEEPPFYNTSCIIYPPGQSLVYTVAAINPTITQVFYRTAFAERLSPPLGVYGSGNYVTRILDFNISLDHPIIYLSKPLVNHRLHGLNQSLIASAKLDEVLGQFELSKLFIQKLRNKRVDDGLVELYESKIMPQFSKLSLRYCKRDVLLGNYEIARRYFYLSAVFSAEITDTDDWKILSVFFSDTEGNKCHTEEYLKEHNDFQRTSSYGPPDGYYKSIELLS